MDPWKEALYYTKGVTCTNCNDWYEIKIPKGTQVIDFLKEKRKCDNCGCESLIPSALE